MWISSAEVCAVNYYVDGTNGNDGNPGTINQPWQTINKANSTLQAGDTVHMRGGTYAGQIKPANSGTSGNYIIYQRYSGDAEWSVIISTQSYGAYLLNKNYITIDGLYFNNCGHRWIFFDNSDYNIVQNCKFYDADTWAGIHFDNGSTYNKILDNIFPDAPLSGNANGTSPADLINADFGDSYGNHHNLIEGNEFNRSCHASVAMYEGDYTVIRGNTFINDFHTGIGPGRNALVENNLIYDSGINIADNVTENVREKVRQPGIQLNYPGNIIRKNTFDNNGAGISVASLLNWPEANHNRYYNNTIHGSVHNIKGSHTYDHPIEKNMRDNIWKNNAVTEAIPWPAEGEDAYSFYYRPWFTGYGPFVDEWHNNNCYSTEDEKYRYVDTTATLANIQSAFPDHFPGATNIQVEPKYTDTAGRDFTLQPDSGMINAGAWLTTITSSTASGVSSFVVADSRYFYDGWGTPGEVGDTIKTKNGQITKIQSIDYDTNTITVNPAINIIKNEGIALNYSGSAPDIGAYEYNGVSPQGTVPRLIHRSHWSVIYADSEELDTREKRNAYKVFDGVIETLWGTEWLSTTAPLPHEIQIDVGESYNISGFRYLPRQDYSENVWQENGAIAQYEFYISNNKSNWGSPVADGTFAKNRTEKEVLFTGKKGRYIRLVALSEVNGKPWTVISELNLIGEDADGCLTYEIRNGKDDNCNGEIDETYNNDDWSVGYIAHSVLPQKHYQLIDVDSEELNTSIPGNGFKAFDGVEETTWHTQWLLTEPDPAHPHHISIDLGKTYVVDGFRYLTPQNIAHWENGAINEYNFYVSDNKTNWGVPVSSGNFLMIQDEQEALFAGKKGRYIKLEAISGFNGNPWTSVTELTVLGHDTDSVK